MERIHPGIAKCKHSVPCLSPAQHGNSDLCQGPHFCKSCVGPLTTTLWGISCPTWNHSCTKADWLHTHTSVDSGLQSQRWLGRDILPSLANDGTFRLGFHSPLLSAVTDCSFRGLPVHSPVNEYLISSITPVHSIIKISTFPGPHSLSCKRRKMSTFHQSAKVQHQHTHKISTFPGPRSLSYKRTKMSAFHRSAKAQHQHMHKPTSSRSRLSFSSVAFSVRNFSISASSSASFSRRTLDCMPSPTLAEEAICIFCCCCKKITTKQVQAIFSLISTTSIQLTIADSTMASDNSYNGWWQLSWLTAS